MALMLDSKFEKLIKGQVKFTASNLGCNLLISRLQRKYSITQTPEELKKCVQEMNAFFEKYNTALAKDIDALKDV